MGLETGTYISDLNATNPVDATDTVSQGDDHLRLIKSTILNTFPNITAAVTLTHTQINDAALKSSANTFTAAQAINDALTVTGLATLASVDINGGAIDGAVIGGASPAAGTFTTLDSSGLATLASVDINGGAIDGAVIGGATPAAGVFTTLQSTGLATLASATVSGALVVGVNDTAPGLLTLHGDGAGSSQGGRVRLHAAADYDASINFIDIWAYQDDLYITVGGTNRYSILGSSGDHYWYTTAGAVAMYLDVSTENLNVDGGVIAGGDCSFSGGNVKTFEFGSSFVLRNSADETVIAGTPNAETVLYYNGTSEIQTQDSDANYATSGARVKDHGGTLRDVGFNVMPVIENDATLTVSEIHAGAYIHTDAGTGHTVTLPSGTSGAVPPVGAVITFVNEDNNDVTLSAAGTLRWFNGSGVPSTGNRTIAQGGFVTVIHYSNTEWHILGGAGVS